MVVPDVVTYLITVSADGRWAVALVPRTSSGGGTQVRFIPLRGDTAMDVCNEECGIGFGPNRLQAPMFNWSPDGKWVYVGLQYFGLRTVRTVVLPYRSNVPLTTLWPRGMKSEDDVMANPGAKVLNDGNALPATDPSAHLSWRRTTQSNLYRVALPNRVNPSSLRARAPLDSEKMAITRPYLVRHGATQLSVEDRFVGDVGVELSEEDRAQAERLAARVRDDGISAIYSSPLSRAVETARIIARGCGLEPTSSDRTA